MRLAGWVAVVALAALIFAQSYEGRVHLWESQARGCERGKLDRAANARGWRLGAARAASQDQLIYSRAYALLAAELEKRSRIDCGVAFPRPSPLPF